MRVHVISACIDCDRATELMQAPFSEMKREALRMRHMRAVLYFGNRVSLVLDPRTVKGGIFLSQTLRYCHEVHNYVRGWSGWSLDVSGIAQCKVVR
jgi:hypothetical protein